MKKILSICAVALLFASCSNDDDNQEEFFNLKEGNLWVYKRYYINQDSQQEYLTQIDTVKVTGQETIEGKVYFKLSHSNSIYNEFLRVDEKGHLVNERDVVIHPGTDMKYKYTYLQQSESETYGEMRFSLEGPKDINVEGNSYTVYPYVGFFDSFNDNIPEGIGSYKYYQPGLGMVIDTDRYLSANAYIERRLVHYELH